MRKNGTRLWFWQEAAQHCKLMYERMDGCWSHMKLRKIISGSFQYILVHGKARDYPRTTVSSFSTFFSPKISMQHQSLSALWTAEFQSSVGDRDLTHSCIDSRKFIQTLSCYFASKDSSGKSCGADASSSNVSRSHISDAFGSDTQGRRASWKFFLYLSLDARYKMFSHLSPRYWARGWSQMARIDRNIVQLKTLIWAENIRNRCIAGTGKAAPSWTCTGFSSYGRKPSQSKLKLQILFLHLHVMNIRIRSNKKLHFTFCNCRGSFRSQAFFMTLIPCYVLRSFLPLSKEYWGQLDTLKSNVSHAGQCPQDAKYFSRCSVLIAEPARHLSCQQVQKKGRTYESMSGWVSGTISKRPKRTSWPEKFEITFGNLCFFVCVLFWSGWVRVQGFSPRVVQQQDDISTCYHNLLSAVRGEGKPNKRPNSLGL